MGVTAGGFLETHASFLTSSSSNLRPMSLFVAYTVFFGLVTAYGSSSEVKRHREKMRRKKGARERQSGL